MIPHPTQSKAIADTHRFRVLRCGRRWGKTLMASDEIKALAGYRKDSRIAYIANTYQQARDIMWESLKKDFKGAATNEARLEIRLPNGSLIILRGWESVENLRGQAFDLIVLDEVATMRTFWLNWQEILRPTLTDRKGMALFLSTPKGFNHFYDLCNKELTDSDFKTFHFTSWDNSYLPKEELEQAKKTLPEEVFLQEYEASFQKTQGLVYKEFIREKHLYDKLEDLHLKGNLQKYGGIDFGYRHPAAVLDIFFDGERIAVEDEWYKRERTDAQIAEYVATCKFKAVYPDPENQGGIEELRRKGLNVKEVNKGKGSVEAGIQMIRELFIRGDLMINKKCVNLISEFEMYSYEDERDKKLSEKPIKANDDALDALRYCVSSLLPVIQRKEQRQNFYENPPKQKIQIAM